MTSEQLEELKRFVDSVDNDIVDPYDGVSPYFAADLARRVVAAEKLVAELNLILENDDDHWSMFKCALTSYREASK